MFCMAYISSQTNVQSMNRIITLTDGVCEIEDSNKTTEEHITMSSIYTNDISLNVNNGQVCLFILI